MWNYLYFIFYLWEQDKDDDDGLEQYVRRMVDDEKISWFPINNAMSLQQGASASEQLVMDMSKSVAKNGEELNSKTASLDSELKGAIKTVFKICATAADGKPTIDLDPNEVDIAMNSQTGSNSNVSSVARVAKGTKTMNDVNLDEEPLTDDEDAE
jgi:hypothetical protein